MSPICDVLNWLSAVVLALLESYWRDLIAALAVLLLTGCTLVYVPANTRWTVQAGENGTAVTVPERGSENGSR